MAQLPDTLNPKLNPTGYLAGAGAIYALVTMLINLSSGHGAFNTPVFIAGVGAFASWYVRTKVTPIAAPRDNAGNELVPNVTSGPIPAPGQQIPLTAGPDELNSAHRIDPEPLPEITPLPPTGTVTILPPSTAGTSPPLPPHDPGTLL